MLDIDVKGFNALEKALNGIGERTERNVLRGGLLAAAKLVAADAQRIVKAEAFQTGDLHDSIRASTYTVYRNLGGIPAATVKAGGPIKGKGSSKNKRPFYAHIIEFGAKPHVIRARTPAGMIVNGKRLMSVNHPGVQGIRFMTRAIDNQTQAMITVFQEKVRERIEKMGIDVPEQIPAGDLDNEG